MSLDEERLIEALARVRDRSLEQLPPPEEPHQFSPQFQEQMELLFQEERRRARRKKWASVSRRAAAFLLVGAVSLSACILGVDALREKLFEMVLEEHEEYSNISYAPIDKERTPLPQFDLVEYRPAWLPEGMLLVSQILNSTVNWSTYEDAQGNVLSFHQSVVGTVSSAINTESAELIEFELPSGDTAYKMSNMGSQFVLWNDNQYEYMVLLNGYTLEDAVRVAESVQVCPPGAHHPPQLAVDVTGLPEDYPPQQALSDGMVVVQEDGTVDNLNLVEKFLADYAAGQQSIFGLCDYQKGTPLPTQVYFNGFYIEVTVDETELLGNPPNHRSSATYRYQSAGLVQEADAQVFYLTDEDGESTELFRYASQEG
ncbi:MAG TPA: DUF4367 domain-containing protein [Candidatus Anaerotruncus excrementipullorum]|uniref:DUF4367 domain-containing protein n=1 Tax=Candidatus Anaerotruncus excrementipullorum TaxID=2838465 RepID=A0A9D2B8D0_9FIRM|nr:DUF4367 domain-containing protein [Candidatus Anaerotruncus excrementipullorum]